MKPIYFLGFLVCFLLSCESDEVESYTNLPIAYTKPANFPELAYDLSQNPITEKGFELGKKLFYEGRLSSDKIVSCGFCHIQKDAFTHHGHTLSHGVGDSIGNRNSPSIQNMAYQTSYMWDGSVNHLELQAIVPLTSEVEMNANLSAIVAMMESDETYVKLYRQAFADGKVNLENMLKALTQFMVMLTSSNSKYDKYIRKEEGGTFTSDELEGYTLFKAKCASCHATDLFTDNSFRNNGLPINRRLNDVGRYRVTELEEDLYKFKVPSLRNVEKTAPYMHDGRFFTLEAVLNHYDYGMVDTGTLDASLKTNGTLGIPLTSDEKAKIITFLKTLTDNEFLNDARFAEF